MKVLITGANGFLASNIIRELNKKEIDVKGMVRENSNLLSLKTAKYEKVVGDINNVGDLKNAAHGCDVIIHAAANTSQYAHRNLNMDNIEGTKNVISVSERLRINRLIFVSSANTFGYGSKKHPGDESVKMSPVFKKSPYAYSKYKAQEAVLAANKEGRIKAIVVNPAFMIGKYDAKPSSGKLLTTYLNNPIAICPPGGKSIVHVRDVAVAICNSIDRGVDGTCYLLAGENLTYKEFYNKLATETGQKKKTIFLSKFVLALLGSVGSVINKMGIHTSLNRINTNILSIQNYYSSKKAIHALGMPVSSVDEAISDAISWFSQNNYLKKAQ
jgi:dihydroflavonol-4-reductase